MREIKTDIAQLKRLHVELPSGTAAAFDGPPMVPMERDRAVTEAPNHAVPDAKCA